MDIVEEYKRFFEDKECEGSGFEFPCDKDGTIIVEELNEIMKQNLIMCKKSPNYVDRGVVVYTKERRICPCDSGKYCWEERYAKGISIDLVCEDCVRVRKEQYRDEVFTNPSY